MPHFTSVQPHPEADYHIHELNFEYLSDFCVHVPKFGTCDT